MDLFDALPDYRVRLRALVEDLRRLSPEARRRYAYKNVPLGLETSDLLPLEAVRADGAATTAWQKAVADSVALALIRADLEDGSFELPGDPEDSPFGDDPDAAREHAIGLLAQSVVADLDAVHHSLGKMGPKISELLVRARERADRLSRPTEGVPDTSEEAAPPSGFAEPLDLSVEPSFSPAEPDTAEVVLELESFLAQAHEELRALLDGSAVQATDVAFRGLQETRKLTAREGQALADSASLTDTEASATDRLLVLTATASYWIARQHGRLELPDKITVAPAREMPSGRETVLGILEHLSRLVVSVRELARNRGDRDLLAFLSLLATRWMDLAAFAETLPSDTEADQERSRNITTGIAVHDFEVQFERPEVVEHTTTPTRRTKASARRKRNRKQQRRPEGAQLFRNALAVASLVLTVGSTVGIVRHVLDAGRPPVARRVDPTLLREHMPSAVVPSEASENGVAQVGVGPEWEDWTPEERNLRLTRVCRILSDNDWQRAAFMNPEGQTVARWIDGWIRLVPTEAVGTRNL